MVDWECGRGREKGAAISGSVMLHTEKGKRHGGEGAGREGGAPSGIAGRVAVRARAQAWLGDERPRGGPRAREKRGVD
jgi:hypothetical protein